MKVEVIPIRVKPKTVKELQAEVAKLKEDALVRDQSLSELEKRATQLEQQIKPMEP